jgi:hypothetical protein
MELRKLIFKKAGPHNIQAALQVPRERVPALGIKQVVAASSHRRVGPVKRLVTPKRNRCVTGQIKLWQKRHQSNTGYADMEDSHSHTYRLDCDQAQIAPRVSRGYFWHELSRTVCVALALRPVRAEHYSEFRMERISNRAKIIRCFPNP